MGNFSSPEVVQRSPMYALSRKILLLFPLLSLSVGCTEAPPRLAEATLCRGLTAYQSPNDATTAFEPRDKIHLSLRFDGRPKRGEVSVRFLFGERELSAGEASFEEVNQGVLLSSGQVTYLGFWMELEEGDQWPISRRYRAEVSLNGAVVERLPFSVVPRRSALESRLRSAYVSTDEGTQCPRGLPCRAEQIVTLTGTIDLGEGSWLSVDWYEGQTKLERSSQRFVSHADAENALLSFTGYHPDGRWPPGEHQVVLILNDAEVGRYRFTVPGG